MNSTLTFYWNNKFPVPHRKVEVDESGTAHLTDKEGRDMSVRATGDLYSARLVKDALYCLPIEDVASMANLVASGTGVNLGE